MAVGPLLKRTPTVPMCSISPLSISRVSQVPIAIPVAVGHENSTCMSNAPEFSENFDTVKRMP